jgi:hypothetical protein
MKQTLQTLRLRQLFKLAMVFLIMFFLWNQIAFAQLSNHAVSIDISVEKELLESFNEKGRLFIFMSLDSMSEPRTQIWPNPRAKTEIFAKNIDDFDPKKPFNLTGDTDWIGTPEWTLKKVPAGEYYIQIVWGQKSDESRIDEPGNLYSEKKRITVTQNQNLSFVINQKIESRKIDEHPLVRLVELRSDTLSNWWGKSMFLKASILLPHNHDGTKEYPIRYNVAGYGGRYDRINGALRNKGFMDWWTSGNAPEITLRSRKLG